jgi:hypothetical protein
MFGLVLMWQSSLGVLGNGGDGLVYPSLASRVGLSTALFRCAVSRQSGLVGASYVTV